MIRFVAVLGLAFALTATASARPPAAAVFTVDSNGDAGPGTLRQAILDANANGGVADTIVFDELVLPLPTTITPLSALPTIANPCTIDLTANPDYAGVPLVRIDGASAGAVAGLTISGPNVVVKGLSITGFGGGGIVVTGDSDVIQACYVGLALDGTTAAGNGGSGIRLNGSNTIVGGAGAGEGNVISGNTALSAAGINGFGSGTIRGNRIGTNAAGTAAVPNSAGIAMVSGTGNPVLVGGNLAGQGNLISGNTGTGVSMGTGSAGAVSGNFIGTNAAGTAAIPNGSGLTAFNSGGVTVGGATPAHGNLISGNTGTGVFLGTDGVTVRHNVIGRTAGNAGPLGNGGYGVLFQGGELCQVLNNVIAHGGAHGVYVESGRRHRVTSNSIHSNAGAGIRLGAGVQNDALDTDIGANDLQNHPVVDAAYVVPGPFVVVNGSLQSSPNMNFRLEFFSNSSSPDQGETLVHTLFVDTPPSGEIGFSVFLAPLPAGTWITVTATDALQNSSPFSPPAVIRTEGVAPTVAISDPATPSAGTALGSYPLAVTASDDVAVDSVSVQNAANGYFGLAAFASGVWTLSVPLVAGVENEITATAFDTAGNSATDTATILCDPTGPSVSITIPTATATYDGSATPLSVWGTASDDVGLVSVAWSNSAGGAGTALGLELWAAAVPLVEGTNVITITATDGGGNTATDVLTVDYAPATQTTIVNEGDDCGLLGAEMIGLLLGLRWLRRRSRR